MSGDNSSTYGQIRPDFQRIIDMIQPSSTVLDLGCGGGNLLHYLEQERNVKGQGVEVSASGINACIKKGIDVLQGDILEGLKDYGENVFDYVILSQTLHELSSPNKVIEEMLRVGKKAIVSFYNLAFYKYRLKFFLTGRFPRDFPYNWKNTYASIITLKDFRKYCEENGIIIEAETILDEKGKELHTKYPNWRGQIALFMLENS